MVDRTNLDDVNDLYSDLNAVTQAIANLNAGGRIVSMTISGPAAPSTVPTDEIAYPPQMVDGIRAALNARYETIKQELTNMGLTGIQDSQWLNPAQAQVRRPRPR